MARRPRRAPLATVLLLLVAAGLLAACAQPPAPSARAAAHARRLAQELEERVARLQLLLLEKDAQVRLLNQQLEAGILEVVRAMAKLRGLDSKAEAASNLAETEIAMKSLPKGRRGGHRIPTSRRPSSCWRWPPPNSNEKTMAGRSS